LMLCFVAGLFLCEQSGSLVLARLVSKEIDIIVKSGILFAMDLFN
jgi:hypothetical protein